MKHRTRLLSVGVLLISGLLLFTSRDLPAAGAAPDLLDLEEVWTTGLVYWAAPGQIEIGDFDLDGATDMVTCAHDQILVLNHTSLDTYEPVWYSRPMKCSRVAAGNRDGTGVGEFYVATTDGHVQVVDADTHATLGTISLPYAAAPADLLVADADGDTIPEVIVTRAEDTLFYDAVSLALEWQASGLGGNLLVVANIDGDPDPETLVNGNPAHILNALLQVQEWERAGGFGPHLAAGDVDGDAMAEIAYLVNWDYDIVVYDADVQAIKWQRHETSRATEVLVTDLQHDGLAEVIAGPIGLDGARGYNGQDGTPLWAIHNSTHGLAGLTFGDVDDDGAIEIAWGSSSSAHAMVVGDWQAQAVEWVSPEWEEYTAVEVGDVDLDGSEEIVSATRSRGITAYDGQTHQVEWTTSSSGLGAYLESMELGEFDGDPELEVLAAFGSDPTLRTYDGLTGALEWQGPDLGSGGTLGLEVANLDGDPAQEIVLGLSSGSHIIVLNGATPFIQWDSGLLDGGIEDFDVGELDGDGVLELAVLTNLAVHVFETATWQERLDQPVASGREVAIAGDASGGPGQLLVARWTNPSSYIVESWRGDDFAKAWDRPLAIDALDDILTADLDGDGMQEFLLNGTLAWGPPKTPLLWIGGQVLPPLWNYKMADVWGSITSTTVSDVDGDGSQEVVWTSATTLQVMDAASHPLQRVYLPLAVNAESEVWTTIFEEGFEGTFPGAWLVFDNYPQNGIHYWGKRNCRAFSGTYSGWSIGAGSQGGSLPCGAEYTNNAESWMMRGPMSLADATAAELRFKMWLNSEPNDGLCRMASIDGYNFYGYCTSGVTSVWVDQVLDLEDVYTLGDLTGEPKVWVALIFISDGAIYYQEGAHVDDILMRKCVWSRCTLSLDGEAQPGLLDLREWGTEMMVPE